MHCVVILLDGIGCDRHCEWIDVQPGDGGTGELLFHCAGGRVVRCGAIVCASFFRRSNRFVIKDLFCISLGCLVTLAVFSFIICSGDRRRGLSKRQRFLSVVR